MGMQNIISQVTGWTKKADSQKLKRVAFCLCYVLLIGSSLLLARYFYQSWQTEIEIETLRQTKLSEPGQGQTGGEETGILASYRKLFEQNGDLAGWITIDGTSIDYPVMQTPEEPQYYLRRGFNRQENENGLPFLDAACDMDQSGSNLIIYGHNMKSGLVFAELLNYQKEEFYKEHPVIQLDTLYEQRKYEIVAVFLSKGPSYLPFSFVSSGSEEKVSELLKQVKEQAYYDTGVRAQYGDDFLTLATCDYSVSEGRLVVLAKRSE